MFLRNKKIFNLFTTFFIVLFFSFTTHTDVADAQDVPLPILVSCDIIQLTDNNTLDMEPTISGNTVVWQSWFPGPDFEIYVWDGSSTSRLTDNTFLDVQPVISGNNITWIQAENGVGRVVLWDGTQIRDISATTTGTIYQQRPNISGDHVVWYEFDGNDNEIMLWNGSSVQQLTNNQWTTYWFDISGSRVVWHAPVTSQYDLEVFMWDGTTTQQLTDTVHQSFSPRISGERVVWQAQDGSGFYQIFLWENGRTQKLTDSTYDAARPEIDGDIIAWRGHDGHDWEMFVWDGNVTRQLSNSDFDDRDVRISNGNIVWRHYDGSQWHIYFWDGSSILEFDVQYNHIRGPEISGNNVVWAGTNGDGLQYEIYFTDTTTCIPQNTPPIANTNGPYIVNEGSGVSLYGTGSDSEDTSTDLNYGWDLDADGIFETPGSLVWFSAATLDGPSSFQVSLEVCDTENACAVDTAEITIQNVAPVGSLNRSSATDVFQGESTTLIVYNVFDPAIDDTAAGFRYSFDCHGDGAFEAEFVLTSSFDCSYPNSGTFTAQARITDKDNDSSLLTLPIEVLDLAEASTTVVSDVQTLETDLVLTSGQATSLISKLEGIENMAANGNTNAALNQINAFINQVESLIDEGVLTEQDGFTLIHLVLRLQGLINNT